MSPLFLLSLFILAADWKDAPIEQRHPEAIELFQCDFGETVDLNYDLWPDQWTRRTGPGYPRYIDVEINEDETAGNGRSLLVDLDGGAATIYSPPIAVRDIFSYVLEGRLKTEGLHYDKAYISLTFFNDKQQPVETYYSEKFRESGGWVKIRIGPIAPQNTGLDLAVIGLHVVPEAGVDEDLTGKVWFDDIWFARLPKMTLATLDGGSVYLDDQEIEVTCNVSGILEQNPTVIFELVDVGRQSLARQESRLDGKVVARKTEKISELFGKRAYQDENWDVGYAGDINWKPPIEENGFYEIRATMLGSSGLMHRRIMTLAVVSRDKVPERGEFGWSLPNGEEPLDFQRMFDLLTTAGVNWVKFPVWYNDNDTDRANNLARFAERLHKHNISMVAVIDKPPADIRNLFGEQETMLVANVFAEPLLWRPYVEPILTRLSLTVHYWQLGADDDVSFVGYTNLLEKLQQIRQELRTSGQDIMLGIPWRWMAQTPEGQKPPYDFLAYSILPPNGSLDGLIPMTKDELGAYLDKSKGQTTRFATIYPLPRSRYTTEERARDLVEKMLAAKIHEADAAFIPKPFDHEYGLMNEDGSPAELLLPWRTTARLISGTKYQGSIQLPNRSRNYVFAREGRTVMVVWNSRETEETLYLGDDVKIVDLWGREMVPKQDGNKQIVPVGPFPQFLIGLNDSVATMRLAFQFDPAQLESDFGRTQRIDATIKNTFPAAISGTARLVAPDVWNVNPGILRFKLTRGGELKSPYKILLRADADSGMQPVRIDFNITTDQEYEFSVYREIQVGSGMMQVESSSVLDEESGELIVEATIYNLSEELMSFDCLLYASGRRQMRQRIMNFGLGRTTIVYRIPDGKQLQGSTLLLRLREIGGTRVFNHRVEVKD
ncbi:hypothetical protein AB1L30_18760 [Bremerella sp. JC817]|uniref:hypothetical protein n=1 Tax=Bremerella sp. JC817 TaxID=3231756 RepID=UPI0034599441